MHRPIRLALLVLAKLTATSALAQELPIVDFAPGLEIRSSCRLRIGAGVIAEDPSGLGALRITVPDVEVVFTEGSVLNGAPRTRRPDAHVGIGVVITAPRCRLRRARIEGYRIGVRAAGAHGLVIEDAFVRNVFRQRLLSTPRREDGADWLWPHANDDGEWEKQWGACLSIHDSRNVRVQGCRGRQAQNGILLDRVEASRITGCDFSFLSGWGLGLWRSADNLIASNAFDFCVRGYSHGVYNRGQDSAGILMFEQCSRNVFAWNSATHGGDGFFAFSGREALGEGALPEGLDHEGRGHRANVIIENDFSHAVAHGLELTFAFASVIARNRLVGNGICGIWGGYSRGTLIVENEFGDNGEMAYGLERGGVNIEHGQGNRILANRFSKDRCGVHLWWDEDEGLARTPWSKANGHDVRDEVIADNSFRDCGVGIQLRAVGSGVRLAANEFVGSGETVSLEGGSLVGTATAAERRFGSPIAPDEVELRALSPIGKRRALGGREAIVMSTWGPWDHESTLVREIGRGDGFVDYEFKSRGDEKPHMEGDDGVRFTRLSETIWRVSASESGLFEYAFGSRRDGLVADRLVAADWEVRFFGYTSDPLVDVAAFLDEGRRSTPVTLASIDFDFGGEGPRMVGRQETHAIGPDRFGVLASTTIRLPVGRYVLKTRSDDGIRVRVDDRLVVDNWTIHGPTIDEGAFEVLADREVAISIEYFERDGAAALSVTLGPEAVKQR